MIKLTKANIPDILKRNAEKWTTTLLEAIRENDPKKIKAARKQYNQPEIKEQLFNETYRKCAYCESKFESVTYGDIEHITPKSSDAAETFRWENLTIACNVCNTLKGTKVIIDPYVSDPIEFFDIEGPSILPKFNHEMAKISALALKLNRGGLLERRMEKLDRLRSLMETYLISAPAYKEALRQDLLTNETAAHQEYAAVARNYIAKVFEQFE